MGDNELKQRDYIKTRKFLHLINGIYDQVSIFGHMKLRLKHDIWGT
jgi:hypothetical protein